MEFLVLMVCMAEFTAVLVPPEAWWGHITYILTWPTYLGEWVKENFERSK